jgi:hypothetical protein
LYRDVTIQRLFRQTTHAAVYNIKAVNTGRRIWVETQLLRQRRTNNIASCIVASQSEGHSDRQNTPLFIALYANEMTHWCISDSARSSVLYVFKCASDYSNILSYIEQVSNKEIRKLTEYLIFILYLLPFSLLHTCI